MYSRYYATATAGSPTATLAHTISNSDNANFSWLLDSHLLLHISSANQSLDDFKTAVAAGSTSALSLNNDYSLNSSGELLILAGYGLTAGATYRLYLKRATPKSAHFVDFQAGSPLTELDLDNANNYALFRSQELEDDLAVVTANSVYTLTLSEMKSVASVSGSFVGDTDTQTLNNKEFAAAGTSTFDCSPRSWTE